MFFSKVSKVGLKLFSRKDSPYLYIRGTVRGIHVCESTKISDREAAETIRILRERELLEESIFGRKINATFGQATTAYLQAGGSTRFLPRLIAELESKTLRKIQQGDLDAVARKLYTTASHTTLNRQCYTPFIAVWNHAVRDGWVDVRHWSRPRKSKGTNALRNVKRRAGTFPVEYEHAARFIASMSPGPAILMTTLFYTGMRPIELFSLRADEVDIARRWITLTHTKTGEPRGIPVHEFLVPILESLLRRKDFAKRPEIMRTPRGKRYTVIMSDTEGKGGGGLKNAIKGARDRSGIKDIAPYTGRHTVSTGLVVAGVHPHIKDQILGHASDSMSRHYTNVPQAPLIEAINKLPVPDAWRFMPWLEDPLAWSGKLVEGTGRRTDLGR